MRLVLAIALLFGTALSHAQSCDRSPRLVTWSDQIIDLFVSEGQRAEVAFTGETELVEALPESRDGLTLKPSRTSNKIVLTTSRDDYDALLRVTGSSGRTYLMRVRSRTDCADSVVTVRLRSRQTASTATDSRGRPKGLIWYMAMDQDPPDYSPRDYTRLPEEQRLVYVAGSVRMLLVKEYIGDKFVGSIYELINDGRTPIRFPFEKLDYRDDRVKQQLGRVRKVAMLPNDQLLGPAPEFVSDMYRTNNRGLLLVVSEISGAVRR